ncbi:hypothetical protein, partial [Escherichia coli]|uniref:hypothetical protein n=1 Tax=Escherichia coli TaxID=562 RepID=UPI0028DF46BE
MRILILILTASFLATGPGVAKDFGFPVDGFTARFNGVAETRGSALRASTAECDPPDPDDDEITCRHEIGP